jgi:hypothetical protein
MTGCDLKIEWEDGESGVKQLTITALDSQGEIDLAMELPRIKKLLERDWNNDEFAEHG